MSLPGWQDVVGYEEKTPSVMSRITSGYPRFVFHPLVQQMTRQLGHLPFPSPRVAAMATDFVRRSGATEDEALKAFWQHTGLIVSSRQAEAFLSGRTVMDDP
jgi:cystathionine gamma-synthase